MLIALAGLLVLVCMPPKLPNCTSIGLKNSERCVVCKNSTNRAVIKKHGGRCLKVAERAAAEQLPDVVEAVTARARVCSSSAMQRAGEAPLQGPNDASCSIADADGALEGRRVLRDGSSRHAPQAFEPEAQIRHKATGSRHQSRRELPGIPPPPPTAATPPPSIDATTAEPGVLQPAEQPPPPLPPPTHPTPNPQHQPIAGQYGWYSLKEHPSGKWTPRMPGWLTVMNKVSDIVIVRWDTASAEYGAWREPNPMSIGYGREGATILTSHPPSSEQPTGLRPRGKPSPSQPVRLSLQLYGSYPTDRGTIADLRMGQHQAKSSWPHAVNLSWVPTSGVGPGELEEADVLLRQLFLADQPAPPDAEAQASAAWAEGVKQLARQPTSAAEALERPSELAEQAVIAAAAVDATTLELEAAPYMEGKWHCLPMEVRAAAAQHAINLLERSQPTAEAAVSVIALAGGSVERIPAGKEVGVRAGGAASHPAHNDVVVGDLSAEMQATLEQLATWLMTTSQGNDGKQYSNFDRLRFSVHDQCTESSIYVGVCSGHKKQLPLSNQIGQYNTHFTWKFSEHSQLEIKRQLMQQVNNYIKLAEAQCRLRQPEVCTRQARLRDILGRHAVFRQTVERPHLARLSARDERALDGYLGCGMESTLFTNAYISIGNRTRGVHTDYRNPPITHLSTMLLQPGSTPITGQTVLFDRHLTRAVIVDDSSRGRQVMGGLNSIKHGNFGPKGDVEVDKGC